MPTDWQPERLFQRLLAQAPGYTSFVPSIRTILLVTFASWLAAAFILVYLLPTRANLSAAIQLHDINKVRILASLGAPINLPANAVISGRFGDSAPQGGVTPLREAMWQDCSAAMIRALLEQGADIVAPRGGLRLIHEAAYMGRADALSGLLNAGADHDVRDLDGRSPLMYATMGGRPDATATLLAAGADPNARDNAGLTPLMLIRGRETKSMTRILLASGADPTAVAGGKTVEEHLVHHNVFHAIPVLRAELARRQRDDP